MKILDDLAYALGLWVARQALLVLRIGGWISPDAALTVRRAISQGYSTAITSWYGYDA